ncbi:MAG: hypothetical protein WBA74_17130 [Cyclobacteriaceae bacterium]
MLEYFKMILSKVSFNEFLFEKELKKAIKSLVSEEVVKLKNWCYEKFGDTYSVTLNKHFQLFIT